MVVVVVLSCPISQESSSVLFPKSLELGVISTFHEHVNDIKYAHTALDLQLNHNLLRLNFFRRLPQEG